MFRLSYRVFQRLACSEFRNLCRQAAGAAPWFLKLDVRKYFDGIPHERLFAALARVFREEAVRRLLAFLFGEMQLHRVRANCDPENSASAQMMERLGMRREGHVLQSLWFKGRWADELWYASLQEEWQPEKGAA